MTFWNRLRLILPWLVVAAILHSFASSFDLHTLLETLQSSRWSLAAGATLLNLLLITFSRAKRFDALIARLPREGEPAQLADIISVIAASRMLNLALPARAGETLRALRMQRRHGYSPESILAAIALETLLEAVALSVTALVLISLGFAFGMLTRILYPPVALGAVCLSIALAAVIRKRLSQPTPKTSGAGVLNRLRAAAHLLNDPRTWLRGLGWTWVADTVDVMMIGLCLTAVGVPLDLPHWLILLAGINVAIVIPAPGHIGTLEAGAVLVLGAMGVDGRQALAFALLYHAAHLAPILLLGSLSLMTH